MAVWIKISWKELKIFVARYQFFSLVQVLAFHQVGQASYTLKLGAVTSPQVFNSLNHV